MQIFKLYEMDARELIPGGSVKFVHSDNMTMSFWTFKAGTPLPEHTHPHEQILSVMNGTLEFTIEGESEKVDAPSSVIIPSEAIHSGKCLTACTLIDTFYPKREDFAALDTK